MWPSGLRGARRLGDMGGARAGAGRPSKYSDTIAENICSRMSKGESLRTICAEEGMPDRETVSRWVIAHPDFAAKYAHARALQADELFDRMQDIAENHADVNRAKLIVSTIQWRAEKLAPKVYGPKIEIDGGLSLKIDESALLNQANALLAKMGG